MSKEEGNKAKRSPDEPENALAARRARLRSSLNTPSNSSPQNAVQKNTIPIASSSNQDPDVHDLTDTQALPVHATDAQALKLLGNIDQALMSCASHLASLQKVANKQIDELKVIADALQHQPTSDVGLSINTLMDSLGAAIEPMKAIGELVPALDRLVSISTLKTEPTALNEKELVLSLTEQLAAGKIESFTFKSAFQAIFPGYDLNGQLHQLSELLGEQQISGDLFQIAFSALQSADEISNAFIPTPDDLIPMPSVNWDDNISQGEPFPTQALVSEREIELEKQLADREIELERQLADKERELEEFKEQLDQRWQQLNGAYEELRVTLETRENILRDKEDELGEKTAQLAAKDSENKQLKAQMEELRDQTKEMVADLQKQLAQKHAEEKAIRTAKTKAPAQPGFFELFPGQPQSAVQQNESDKLSSALEYSEQSTQNPSDTRPVSHAPQPVSQTVAQTPVDYSNNSQAAATPNSGFASPTSSFVSAAGSYGSGVRAQVFEVIVRQALAGAHWREICAVPMQINNISPEEVESEVKRRQALLKK